jgi:hypothetical protein
MRSLRRRLTALERRLPKPEPQSELIQLLAFMSSAELEAMHGIVERGLPTGRVADADAEAFATIYGAARGRRERGEPPPRTRSHWHAGD